MSVTAENCCWIKKKLFTLKNVNAHEGILKAIIDLIYIINV